MMQAYAEGFDILRNKDSEDLPEDERFALNVADIAEVWRRGSVISSWLLDLARRRAGEGSSAERLLRLRAGFRRGSLDDRGRDRGGGSGGRACGGAVRALPLAEGAHLRRKDALGHALRLRRAHRRQRGHGPRIAAERILRVALQLNAPPSSAMDDRTAQVPDATQLIACPPRRQAKPADPCAMVIFGATGDLTKRLVMPALYNLLRTKVLPEHFALIGVARTEGTAESWRDQLYDMLKSFVGNAAAEFDIDRIDEAAWKRLAEKMVVCPGRPHKARAVRHAARRARRRRKDTRHPGQRHLLSRGRRSVFRRRGGATRPGGADRPERSPQRQALGFGAAW